MKATRMKVPKANRWVTAIAATVVMLLTGTIYSWAIFTEPLIAAYRWHLAETTWTYALANFCLAAAGTVIGGLWQDSVGPRRVALAGVALWGCGNVLAGLGTSTFGAPWLYVTYGVVGGVGAGMAYITPVAMITKWFPNRKGLAGGAVVSGFGLGAFFYNQLVPRLSGFHAATFHAHQVISLAGLRSPSSANLAQVLTESDIAAVMHVFVASGLFYLIVGLMAASLFSNPPAKTPDGQHLDPNLSIINYSPSQVLATSQFYLLWLLLFINAIAGIAIISNAVYIITDLTQLSASAAATAFGCVSISNAMGRFLWAAISDHLGCARTFAALFAVQAFSIYLLTEAHSSTLVLLAISLILLCCGGGFGTMPSFNAKYFGSRHMGVNYGLILTAWGFAGLLGPMLIAQLKDLTGSFKGVLPFMAAALVVCIVIPLTIRPPGPRSDFSAREVGIKNADEDRSNSPTSVTLPN